MSTGPSQEQEPQQPRPSGFLALLSINALLATLLFGFSCLSFALFTGRMHNHFAELVRRHHLGMAVMANLKTLPAYALLAALYTLMGFSLLARSRWLAAVGRREQLRRLALVLLVNGVLFVLSMGPLIQQSPGLLDAAGRYLGGIADWLEPHVLVRYHVLEFESLICGLLTLYAGGFYGWLVLRSLRGRRHLAVAFSLLCVLGAAVYVSAPWQSVALPATPQSPQPNILILASDSLRFDHFSGHGYPRPTTPRIDRFAADNVDFLNMHVSAASTLESWMTVMHSQFPTRHGIRYMFPTREMVEHAAASPDSLPRILRNHGYYTSVVSDWAGNCFKQVDMGIEHNLAADIQNLDVFVAEAVLKSHAVMAFHLNNSFGKWLVPEVQKVVAFLDPKVLSRQLRQEMRQASSRGQPFFGLLFLSETHLPFLSSWPYDIQFADPRYRGPNRYRIDLSVDTLIQRDLGARPPAEQIQHIIDLYDGAVREFDDTVGDLLDELQASGYLKNTLVIVTTDHGEDLYEKHTSLGHGTNFFSGDQATHIPFIVHMPDSMGGPRAAGVRVERTVRNVDIAPLILDAVGLGAAIPGSYQGVSLLPYIVNGPDGEPPDLGLPAFAETSYLFFPKRGPGLKEERLAPLDETLRIDESFRNQFVLKERYHRQVIDSKDRMMRTERWKLIQIPYGGGFAYRFYDMREDPHQEHDLSESGGPVLESMKRELELYWSGRADLRWPRSADDDGLVPH